MRQAVAERDAIGGSSEDVARILSEQTAADNAYNEAQAAYARAKGAADAASSELDSALGRQSAASAELAAATDAQRAAAAADAEARRALGEAQATYDAASARVERVRQDVAATAGEREALDRAEAALARATAALREATDLSGAKVAPIRGRGYDGKPYTPKPKVTLNGKTLVDGIDYTLSYRNNVSAGKATLTVTGKGYYTGSTTATFAVWKNGQPMTAWAVARSAPAASLRTRDVVVESPIHVAHAVSAAKPMEYRKVGGDSRLKVDKATGRVTVRKGTPAGTYKVKIRAIAFGGSNYADGSRTVECPVKVVSGAKMNQSFQVTATEVARSAASLVSADYLTRPFKVAMAAGNVTYKRVSGNACLDVDSSGRLRVKRGTKAGTYYVKVYATAAGDAGYKPCTRSVTAKVVVK